MRTLFTLGLGLVSGITATVLLFTLNDALSGQGTAAPGVGNSRVVMDSRSLGLMATSFMIGDPDGIPIVAEVDIRSEGTLVVSFAVAPKGSGPQGSVVLNPEVREGRLVVTIVDADVLGATPESIAEGVEEELLSRLDSLAGNAEYTLVSIATAGNQLVLEITV